MKNIKKLLALVLALAICAAFALPALAEGEDDKSELKSRIIMQSITEGHTYYVYQIYTGDISGEPENYVLSNVVYGKNYAADSYKTGDQVPQTELDGIMKDGAEAFAKSITPSGEPVAILDKDKMATGELPAGYYLVVDKGIKQDDGSFKIPTGENAVMSAFMVELVGTNVPVTPKTKVPEVNKTVEEANTSKENAKQEQMNKELVFHLTATLPADPSFTAYEKYMVKFTDTMGKGITFDSLESVTIKSGDSTAVEIAAKSDDNPNGYTLNGVNDGDKGQKEWTVTIDDIKKIEGFEDITKGIVIEVVYKGHLNEEATVVTTDGDKDGNKNTVKLTYSNDPEGDSTGETPEKDVFVFTFGLDNFKYVVENDEKLPKAGAGFTLYKEDGTTVIPLYKIGDEYYVYNGTDNVPENATVLKGEGIENEYEMITTESGKFNVNGLAEGTYILKETTTPTGYNTAPDMKINISATYKEEGGQVVVDQVTVKLGDSDTASEGGTKIEIENKKGSQLPSTGGMGTTILYIVGAVLVIGAGVVLFTKRRMSN